MNGRLVWDLSAGHFVIRHEALPILAPPGTGKSHLAQAMGPVLQQVLYREADVLLEELADATVDGIGSTPCSPLLLLFMDDLGMRRLRPLSAKISSSW